MTVKALFFDVFGTLVDWRTGVAHEAERILVPLGVGVDWLAFADAWRAPARLSRKSVAAPTRSATVKLSSSLPIPRFPPFPNAHRKPTRRRPRVAWSDRGSSSSHRCHVEPSAQTMSLDAEGCT